MAFALTTPKSCEECGENALFHGATYFSILLDDSVFSLFAPRHQNGAMSEGKARFERWVGPRLLELFVKIGWAKKVTVQDDKTHMLGSFLWAEADARDISVWEWRLFGLSRNTFVATLPSGEKLVYEGMPMPLSDYERVWWMDDKARLKKEFEKRGLPMAKGGAAGTKEEALKIYRSLTPPVIVKPHSGSGSRHTFMHLADEETFLLAFKIAKQISPKVVIEEELIGPVYRVTVVNGKMAAALRRYPPMVIGDDIHTVTELVVEENKNPQRSGPYFSPIRLSEKTQKELQWQDLTLESIPEQGRQVTLHQKINWHIGGITEDATDEVHPDNKALFERAAHELKAPVAGIDFIIGDIRKSWEEQERCGILECNSMPFIENHHLPFRGQPRNVAGKIWDMVIYDGMEPSSI